MLLDFEVHVKHGVCLKISFDRHRRRQNNELPIGSIVVLMLNNNDNDKDDDYNPLFTSIVSIDLQSNTMLLLFDNDESIETILKHRKQQQKKRNYILYLKEHSTTHVAVAVLQSLQQLDLMCCSLLSSLCLVDKKYVML
jgi:hypothetical protein